MAMEHIVRHTCRFNVKNPQHKKINEVLANLNTDVCKSKSQFMIDAIEFYINNFGKESFIVRRRIEIGANCILNSRLLPTRLCSHTGNCAVQEGKLQLLVALFQRENLSF